MTNKNIKSAIESLKKDLKESPENIKLFQQLLDEDSDMFIEILSEGYGGASIIGRVDKIKKGLDKAAAKKKAKKEAGQIALKKLKSARKAIIEFKETKSSKLFFSFITHLHFI